MFCFLNGGEEKPSGFHFYYFRLIELFKWCLLFFFFPLELQTLEMKKVVKSYNKMAAVLLEFELIYHRAWCRFADQARNALCASLLVRHPETKVWFILGITVALFHITHATLIISWIDIHSIKIILIGLKNELLKLLGFFFLFCVYLWYRLHHVFFFIRLLSHSGHKRGSI